MSKQYGQVKVHIPRPVGGFMEAFRTAIVEFTSFGTRQFDIAGYPYDTEAAALSADWDSIAHDFHAAATKVLDEHDEETRVANGRT